MWRNGLSRFTAGGERAEEGRGISRVELCEGEGACDKRETRDVEKLFFNEISNDINFFFGLMYKIGKKIRERGIWRKKGGGGKGLRLPNGRIK